MKNKLFLLYVLLNFFLIYRMWYNSSKLYLFLLLTLQLLFFIYNLFLYYKKRNYFKKLAAIDKYQLYNDLQLPNPIDKPTTIFNSFLTTANQKYRTTLHQLEATQKDYIEFIELWVHEVKTPLSALYLMNQNHPQLEEIENLLNFALYYSKSNHVKEDYFIQPLSLVQLIKATIKKHKTIFIEKNMQPIIPENDVTVFSDNKWLSFVLFQVVDNALKYSPNQSKIVFEIDQKQHYILLKITDYGHGISQHDLPRVFEKGFTGSNRKNHKSTGFGLYLVKKICDQLHHQIIISSNNGTTVTIHFPKQQFFESEKEHA